jgi:CheY-like chemotaxis protein
MLGVETNLYFAENDLEAWSQLQGNNKVCPTPKILLIDVNQRGINGIDLINKIKQR